MKGSQCSRSPRMPSRSPERWSGKLSKRADGFSSRRLPDAKSPQEALLLLRRIVALPHHRFWEDDVSLATSNLVDAKRLTGYRQVTDLHLVTLALQKGGRLATIDGKIRSLVPRGYAAQE